MDAHPKLAGYDAFFDTDIAPLLADAETVRQEKIKLFYKYGFLPILLSLIVAYFVRSEPILILFSVAVGGVLTWMVYGGLKAEVTSDLKKTVMDKLCQFLGLSYSATSTGRLEPRRFLDKGILPGWDEISTEDEIYGSYKGVELSLLEAQLVEVRHTRDSDGNSEETRRTIFQGLLLKCDFPKRFNGETRVLRDSWFKLGKGGERVQLEDPEFEKRYDVYSDDQVEARFLLTPLFMERVKRLDELSGANRMQLAFAEEQLLLAFDMGIDQFEIGGIFSNINDKSRIDKMAEQLTILFEVVDGLSLDDAEY